MTILQEYLDNQYSTSEQKEWQNKDFTEEQVKQWIEVGLTANEASFATWLRDVKSKDIENCAEPQWIKTNTDLNELRQAYQQSPEVKIDMQAQIQQTETYGTPGSSK